jgi:hypothetical protein
VVWVQLVVWLGLSAVRKELDHQTIAQVEGLCSAFPLQSVVWVKLVVWLGLSAVRKEVHEQTTRLGKELHEQTTKLDNGNFGHVCVTHHSHRCLDEGLSTAQTNIKVLRATLITGALMLASIGTVLYRGGKLGLMWEVVFYSFDCSWPYSPCYIITPFLLSKWLKARTK